MARKLPVQVGLEPDTLEDVDELADERGISRSQLIREATRNEVQKHADDSNGGENA